MPWTPCAITIEPSGVNASVTIRRNNSSGRVASAYTTENGSSLHSFPKEITSATTFWLGGPGIYYVEAVMGAGITDVRTVTLERFQHDSYALPVDSDLPDLISGLPLVLRGPFDGTTDMAGRLQKLVDMAPDDGSGIARIQIIGGGSCLLDTSVWIDDTETRRQYIFEGDGRTTVKLGENLTEASTFSYDSGIGWAFHNNNLRTAGSTYSDGNRATGSGYPFGPRVVFKNLIFEAADTSSGIIYSNTAAVSFENCIRRYGVRFGMSWRGYTDNNNLSRVSSVGADGQADIDSWFVVQETFGDGMVIEGCKFDLEGLWNAKWCNGGQVRNQINGLLKFQQCRGIKVLGGHWEAHRDGGADLPMIDVDRSHVTIDDPYAYAGPAGTDRYIVRINDTNGEDASMVTLRSPWFLQYVSSDDDDPGRVADVYVNAANEGTRLRVSQPTGAVSVQPGGNTVLNTVNGILIESAVAGITTALGQAHGMVGPEAELRYRAGSWEVVDPSMLGGARVVRALSAPTFSTVSSNTTVAGSLTESTDYYYTAALRDQDGNYTTLGTTRNATAPASGSLILLMQIATTPADLVIWRRDQSGVESAPDVYVVIPVNGYDFRGYDTGSHINGRPWVDSDVPVPNTVAAANATSDRLVLPGDPLAGLWTPADQGMLAWSFDPGQADLTNANITSGTLHLVTLNCPAAEISNFHIRIGTGGTTVAHAFMAAYDYHSGALLGATADLTTNWQSAGTKTHAASSAFTHKGGKIRVGFYAQVTTGNVAVGRGNGTSTILNANLGTAASRCGTADTGLTTALPDPHDTVAASANLWWVALS